MSERSSWRAFGVSDCVRKMKNATTSTEASLFSHCRSARTSLVGRPATWSTRTRSRATLNVRSRRSFSGIGVAGRRRDRDLEDARARAIERDREVDGALAVLEVREAGGEQRRRAVLAELARGDRELVARQTACAADLHLERQRNVRDGGARGGDATHARVGRRHPTVVATVWIGHLQIASERLELLLRGVLARDRRADRRTRRRSPAVAPRPMRPSARSAVVRSLRGALRRRVEDSPGFVPPSPSRAGSRGAVAEAEHVEARVLRLLRDLADRCVAHVGARRLAVLRQRHRARQRPRAR